MKTTRTTCIALLAFAGMTIPTQAEVGRVRVTILKAGFVVGGGGGVGMLTFQRRNYPFTVQGLSVGLTAGASASKLTGRVEDIKDPRDFAGTYSVLGAGVALLGGVGSVQLRNEKGVTLTLHGHKTGLELSANFARAVVTLDPSRSVPD